MQFTCLQAQIENALRMKCTASIQIVSDLTCIFSIIVIVVEIQ